MNYRYITGQILQQFRLQVAFCQTVDPIRVSGLLSSINTT